METSGYRHSQPPMRGTCPGMLRELAQRPQFFLRIFSVVFAVIVLAITARQVDETNGTGCVFINSLGNPALCFLAIGVASMACLTSLIFLVLDCVVLAVSDDGHMARCIQVADLSLGSAGSILWLVTFCYAAHEWQGNPYSGLSDDAEGANAVLAFSFFSVATWLTLAVFGGAAVCISSGISVRRAGYKRIDGDESQGAYQAQHM